MRNGLLFLHVIFLTGVALPYKQADAVFYTDSPLSIGERTTGDELLANCKLDENSRFRDSLKELQEKTQGFGQSSRAVCPGSHEHEPIITEFEGARKLVIELRKLREKELYQVQALNTLIYHPTAYDPNDVEGKIHADLKAHLCERAKTAASAELQAAYRSKEIVLGKNETIAIIVERETDCYGRGADKSFSKTLDDAAQGALVQFKEKNLHKITNLDLEKLNDDLSELQKECEAVKPSRAEVSAVLYAPEQIRDPAAPYRAVRDQYYTEKIFPIVKRIFSSPFGRLLANSPYLENKIGLLMEANWLKSDFCQTIEQNVQLSKNDINTGYFGSPSNKIKGETTLIREQIGDLLLTRIPILEKKFWKNLKQESSFQRDLAQAQQQIAYELYFQSKSPDIKKLLHANPVYAEVACHALKHEAFWESESVRNAFKRTRIGLQYGGFGISIIGGFFSGGSGWVVSGMIASGLATSTAGTLVEMKSGLDFRKKGMLEDIENTQRAIVEQAGTRDKLSDGELEKVQTEFSQLSREEQSKFAEIYEKSFSEEMSSSDEASRNYFEGRIISKQVDPIRLRSELLLAAKADQKSAAFQIFVSTLQTLSPFVLIRVGKWAYEIVKDYRLIRAFAKVGEFTKLSHKLNSVGVTPMDILNAFATCWLLKDCSGSGLVTGAVMGKTSHGLNKMVASLKANPALKGKTHEELLEFISSSVSKASLGVIPKKYAFNKLKALTDFKLVNKIVQDEVDASVRHMQSIRGIQLEPTKEALIRKYSRAPWGKLESPSEAKAFGDVIQLIDTKADVTKIGRIESIYKGVLDLKAAGKPIVPYLAYQKASLDGKDVKSAARDFFKDYALEEHLELSQAYRVKLPEDSKRAAKIYQTDQTSTEKALFTLNRVQSQPGLIDKRMSLGMGDDGVQVTLKNSDGTFTVLKLDRKKDIEAFSAREKLLKETADLADAALIELNMKKIALSEKILLQGVERNLKKNRIEELKSGFRSASDLIALSTKEVPPNIQGLNFPKARYKDVTSRMKTQVDDWIRHATPERRRTLESHRSHLRGLEADLNHYSVLLEAEGYSVDRIRAQIWTHDIGKFIPPHELVVSRHQNKADPMMASFMDHSKTSQNYIIDHPFFSDGKNGETDNITRQLYFDIARHDGPSVEGTWYFANYEKFTARKYDNYKSSLGRPGSAPMVSVDRLDQPALRLEGRSIVGGPMKIAYQVRGQAPQEVKDLGTSAVDARSVWWALSDVPRGTTIQLKELRGLYQPKKGSAIGTMLDDLDARIHQVEALHNKTFFYLTRKESKVIGMPPSRLASGNPPEGLEGAIGYVEVEGKRRYFKSVEEFFGTDKKPGAAFDWYLKYGGGAGVPLPSRRLASRSPSGYGPFQLEEVPLEETWWMRAFMRDPERPFFRGLE